MNCVTCRKPLNGLLDTFGLPGSPTCWSCYAELGSQPVYGLGPHVHHFGPDGRVTTEFLDQSPTDDFMPDPDAPGLGIWTSRLPGWR